MKTDVQVCGSGETTAHTAYFLRDNYVAQRLAPGLRDLDYPHLKDLADLLRSLAPEIKGDLFDYGCGGAPYRSLFSNCRRYVAADLVSGPAVERVLEADGTTGEPDASYDAVLSTQVLEHVKDPGAYLRECYRILRPGGQLLLTTHGIAEEHGCPFDFHRWTSNGLEQLVTRCQFRVMESAKLTTEIRAIAQLVHQMSRHLCCPEKRFLDLMLRVVRKAHAVLGAPALNWFLRFFPEQAKVAATSRAGLYMCVYVRAQKGG